MTQQKQTSMKTNLITTSGFLPQQISRLSVQGSEKMSINIRINEKEAYILNKEALIDYYKIYRNEGFFSTLLTHPGLDAFEEEIDYANIDFNAINTFIKCKSTWKTIDALRVTPKDNTYEWLKTFLDECYSLVFDESGFDFILKVVKWYFFITYFKKKMTQQEEDYVKRQLGFKKVLLENDDSNVYVAENGNVYFLRKDGNVFCDKRIIAQNIKCFSYGSEKNIIYLKIDGTLDETLTENAPLSLWKNKGRPRLKQVVASGTDFLLLTVDGVVLEKEFDPFCNLEGIYAAYVNVGVNTRNIIDVEGNLHSNIPAINSLKLKNLKAVQSELKQSTEGKWVCNWFAINKDGCMYYANETTPYSENVATCNTISDIVKAKIYDGKIYYIKYGTDNLFKLDVETGVSEDTKIRMQNKDFCVVDQKLYIVDLINNTIRGE